MFFRALTTFVSLSVVVAVMALSYLHESQGLLALRALNLRAQAVDLPSANFDELRNAAYQKAVLYEELINRGHLEEGMVVTLKGDGIVDSRCDSLLFSSLRYVALKKLGMEEKATDAWEAIGKSKVGSQWLRHPKCSHRISRDMILGLLAALAQEPTGHKKTISELLQFVGRNNGYFGNGPFHVSYLSPGLGEIVRNLAVDAEIDESLFPPQVKFGFSTLSLDTIPGHRGYRSHLNALVLWLEMEMEQEFEKERPIHFRPIVRSVFDLANWSSKLASLPSATSQRKAWLTTKLWQVDRQNLFFDWLRHRSVGALTEPVRARMLTQLLGMSQFPDDRLPNNCDRKADYLWQRYSAEYLPSPNDKCDHYFHGVDYLWMSSLLLADDVKELVGRKEEPATEKSLAH